MCSIMGIHGLSCPAGIIYLASALQPSYIPMLCQLMLRLGVLGHTCCQDPCLGLLFFARVASAGLPSRW